MSPALRASGTRVAPVALGALAGVAAYLLAPKHAADGFFNAAAGVLPVLLLALAIEARIFGGGRRSMPRSERAARHIESARRVLEAGTIAALIGAEWDALDALVRDGHSRDASLVYLGLAWGFVTAGALAFLGGGRARPTASIGARAQGVAFILEVGMGNDYGDQDVTPIMNLLVPSGLEICACDRAGNPKPPACEVLPAREVFAGEERDFDYVSARPLLSAGGGAVLYFLVARGEPEIPVILRLDHVKIRGGRVEDRVWVSDNSVRPEESGPN